MYNSCKIMIYNPVFLLIALKCTLVRERIKIIYIVSNGNILCVVFINQFAGT